MSVFEILYRWMMAVGRLAKVGNRRYKVGMITPGPTRARASGIIIRIIGNLDALYRRRRDIVMIARNGDLMVEGEIETFPDSKTCITTLQLK